MWPISQDNLMSYRIWGLFICAICAPSFATATPAQTYVKTLSIHFKAYPSKPSVFGCTDLSRTLGAFYQSPVISPGRLHLKSKKSHPSLSIQLEDALTYCLSRYASFKRDSILRRHRAVTALLDRPRNVALALMLKTIFPTTPQKMPLIFDFTQDLKKTAKGKMGQTARINLNAALTITQAILNPEVHMQKTKQVFSFYFYLLFEANVWRTHFRYKDAFAPIKALARLFYAKKQATRYIANRIKPFEKLFFKSRLKNVPKSPKYILKQMRWLAWRGAGKKAWKAYYAYSAKFEKPKKSQKKTRSRITTWQANIDNIKGIWTQGNPKKALKRTHKLVKDISSARPWLRIKRKTKDLLGQAYLILGLLYEEKDEFNKAKLWLQKADPYCYHSRHECFLSYHRVRIYLHLTHTEYSTAVPFLNRVIGASNLSNYEKQEFYFWKWLVLHSQKKKFNYTFPYLSIYSEYARCIDPKVVPKSPPLRLSQKKTIPFNPQSLKKILSRTQLNHLKKSLVELPDSYPTRYLLQIAAQALRGHFKKYKTVPMDFEQFSAFLRTIQKYDLYHDSISLLYQYVKHRPINQIPTTLLKYYFPLEYEEAINKASKIHDVPMPLISGLIRRESIFKNDALSPAFALGLMQMLPETAQRISKQFDLPYDHYTENKQATLFIPDQNVFLGALYIKDLMNDFQGNPIPVIASYNAGENKVKQWLKRYKHLQDFPILFVERIPYKETRQYVKWVTLNNLYYTKLYKPKKTKNLTHSFCTTVRKNPLL